MLLFVMSEERLKRFSYHWFWGLRFQKAGDYETVKPNMSEEVKNLQNNSIRLQSMQRTLAKINTRNTLTRAIHWLFNINNYRFYYYALNSFYSIEIYQEAREKKLIAQDNLTINNAFNIDIHHPIIQNYKAPHNPHWLTNLGPLSHFMKKCLSTLLPPDTSFLTIETPSHEINSTPRTPGGKFASLPSEIMVSAPLKDKYLHLRTTPKPSLPRGTEIELQDLPPTTNQKPIDTTTATETDPLCHSNNHP